MTSTPANNLPLLGILGGGQLGKMLLQAASKIQLPIKVYDPSNQAPCQPWLTNNHFVINNLMDYNKVLEFGRQCDIVTYEIEHVNVKALFQLQSEGILVFPKPETLVIIQNKHRQKMFFVDHSLPTANFKCYSNIHLAINGYHQQDFSLPCFWKQTTF